MTSQQTTAVVNIEELERLEKAATPGPWTLKKPTMDGPSGFRNGVTIAATYGRQMIYADPPGGQYPASDAALIATIRNAAPELIAAYKERDELKASLESQVEEQRRMFFKALKDRPIAPHPIDQLNNLTKAMLEHAEEECAALTARAEKAEVEIAGYELRERERATAAEQSEQAGLKEIARLEADLDAWRNRESETQSALQAIGEEFGVYGGEPRTSGIRRVLTEQRKALATMQRERDKANADLANLLRVTEARFAQHRHVHEQLEADLKAAREALIPFGAFADALSDIAPDAIALGICVNGGINFGPSGGACIGDLRRAARVLSNTPAREEKL